MLVSASIVFASLFVPVVLGHGVITNVQGSNGVTGAAFGVIADTPRDGTRARPFQQDSSIIRDREITRGTSSACGRTKAGGVNDIATNVAAASSAGLPAADANGQVSMTLHQVNGDGAGPYTCAVSTDATGNSFQAMTVVTQVPGTNSRSRAKATDFPLVAQMPAGATCTGGPQGNACLVRCRNSAAAGPFGGCVAVTTADSANNATAEASTSSAAETSVATDSSDAATSTTAAAESITSAAAGDDTDEDVATAEAEEAEADSDEEDDTAPAADAKATGKGKGLLAGILGKFNANQRDSTRRMLKSRIVASHQVGMWI